MIMTVLVLAYCLRNSRIVDVFPEIDGRNIKLVDHEDEQPWPQFCAKFNSLFARSEENDNPRDSRVRDVIQARLPDQNPVVNEVDSFLKV